MILKGSLPGGCRVWILACLAIAGLVSHRPLRGSTVPDRGEIDRKLGALPVGFEALDGGRAVGVLPGRRNALSASLAATEASITLGAGAEIRLSLVGASKTARQVPSERQPGTTSFFFGSDPKAWRTGVARYGRITYTGVYPGIDVSWHGTTGELEYDFIVAPRVDVSRIRMRISGASSMRLADDGRLLLDTPAGTIAQRKPLAYEIDGDRRVVIPARYVVSGHEVKFAVHRRNPNLPLVIDPVLTADTVLGSDNSDFLASIKTDVAGNLYLFGEVRGVGYPVVPGSFQHPGARSLFVLKLSQDFQLIYTVYIAGVGPPSSGGLCVDRNGSAAIAVNAFGPFPVTPGAFKTSLNGFLDIYVARINPQGSSLIYGTYLGGSSHDSIGGIDCDAFGTVFVTGNTISQDFPTVAALYSQPPGFSTQAFITRINPSGSSLDFSTYFGGPGGSLGYAVAVGNDGVYVAGRAASDFPTTIGGNAGQESNFFALRLNHAGSAVAFSTLAGFPSTAYVTPAILVALPQGGAMVAGLAPAGLPTGAGSYQPAFGGGESDAFFIRFDSSGNRLYTSYLGGAGYDIPHAAALSGARHVAIVGATHSSDFPQRGGVRRNRPSDLIFKSTDKGNSWTPVSLPVDLHQVPYLAVHNSRIFLGTSYGLFQSDNGGASWSRDNQACAEVDPFTGLNGCRSVTISANGSFVAAWDSLRLYAGQSIPLSFAGTSPQNIYDVAVRSDGTIFVATASGIYRVDNPSRPWTKIADYLATDVELANDSVLVANAQGSTGFLSSAVAISHNGGVTWQKFDAPSSGNPRVSPDNPNHILWFGEAISRSLDGGASWTPQGSLPGVNEVIAVSDGGVIMWCAATGDGLFVSTDQGATWTLRAFGIDSPLWRVAKDSQNSSHLYVSTLPKADSFVAVVDIATGQLRSSHVFDLATHDEAWGVAGFGPRHLYVGGRRGLSPSSTDVFVRSMRWAESPASYATGSWSIDDTGGSTFGRRTNYGSPGDIPITGDWDGDGRVEIGLYRHGQWILDANGNGYFDLPNQPGGDRVFQYSATAGDVPLTGDWNGDGRTDTGIFRNGLWVLDYNGDGIVNYSALGVDRLFQYTATPGDIPLVGDWGADGRDKTGIFRDGLWVLDVDGDGRVNYANPGADRVMRYSATPGDIPVVGDWTGDGYVKTGIFRGGLWILDANGSGGIENVNVQGGDRVFQYSATPGDTPLIGDWNGDGRDETGIWRSGLWVFDVNGDGTVNYSALGVDRAFFFGDGSHRPVTGFW